MNNGLGPRLFFCFSEERCQYKLYKVFGRQQEYLGASGKTIYQAKLPSISIQGGYQTPWLERTPERQTRIAAGGVFTKRITSPSTAPYGTHQKCRPKCEAIVEPRQWRQFSTSVFFSEFLFFKHLFCWQKGGSPGLFSAKVLEQLLRATRGEGFEECRTMALSPFWPKLRVACDWASH